MNDPLNVISKPMQLSIVELCIKIQKKKQNYEKDTQKLKKNYENTCIKIITPIVRR